MHSSGKGGERCPMCETRLLIARCEVCNGTGRWFMLRCPRCRGSGTKHGCPNFFTHPGVGPQQLMVRPEQEGLLLLG